ncbi:hypothetical protein [Mucisphaera sp.]|uniref:hypothetical protein n=1 Tax=Mucisphaera sp. TaxID=2913024 RepID=UPI003D0EA9CA
MGGSSDLDASNGLKSCLFAARQPANIFIQQLAATRTILFEWLQPLGGILDHHQAPHRS